MEANLKLLVIDHALLVVLKFKSTEDGAIATLLPDGILISPAH